MHDHCEKNEIQYLSNDFTLANMNEQIHISATNNNSLINNTLFESKTNISNDDPIENIPNDENFNKCSTKKIQKNVFSVVEDKMLLSLVNKYGEKNWSIISNCMKQYNYDRSIRQCKDRYFHYLDPKISNYTDWTAEEDQSLLNYVQKFGKKWKLSENFFPGRTEVSIRNRYQVLIRKFTRDQKLIAKKQMIMKKKQSDYFDNFFKNYLKIRDKSILNPKPQKKNIPNFSFDGNISISQISYEKQATIITDDSKEKKYKNINLFSFSDEENDSIYSFDELLDDNIFI